MSVIQERLPLNSDETRPVGELFFNSEQFICGMIDRLIGDDAFEIYKRNYPAMLAEAERKVQIDNERFPIDIEKLERERAEIRAKFMAAGLVVGAEGLEPTL